MRNRRPETKAKPLLYRISWSLRFCLDECSETRKRIAAEGKIVNLPESAKRVLLIYLDELALPKVVANPLGKEVKFC